MGRSVPEEAKSFGLGEVTVLSATPRDLEGSGSSKSENGKHGYALMTRAGVCVQSIQARYQERRRRVDTEDTISVRDT